jgi:hypothetical protein
MSGVCAWDDAFFADITNTLWVPGNGTPVDTGDSIHRTARSTHRGQVTKSPVLPDWEERIVDWQTIFVIIAQNLVKEANLQM